MRRFGKSFAHPLFVLIVHPYQGHNQGAHTRFGITASRGVGNAVKRNRAKRLLREALRPLIPSIKPGQDVVIIARQAILDANFTEVARAMNQMIKRAGLIEGNHGN